MESGIVFNRRLYRMKEFYETYCGDEFVGTLLARISWSNYLIIMSKARTVEERHFYITPLKYSII